MFNNYVYLVFLFFLLIPSISSEHKNRTMIECIYFLFFVSSNIISNALRLAIINKLYTYRQQKKKKKKYFHLYFISCCRLKLFEK